MKMGNTEIIIASSAAIVAAAIAIGMIVNKKKSKDVTTDTSSDNPEEKSSMAEPSNVQSVTENASADSDTSQTIDEKPAKTTYPEVSFETLVSWEMKTHEAAKMYKSDTSAMEIAANEIWTSISKDGYEADESVTIPDDLKPVFAEIKNGSADAGNAYDKLIRTIMTKTGNSGSKGNRTCSKENIDIILMASDNLLN